ncbi:MAG: Fe-S cluster assembly protein SufD [Alkalispirochaetaceae bacterium]
MNQNVEAMKYKGLADIPRYIEGQDEPSWLSALRRQAYEVYSGQGWPTAQDEEWRRSDISMYDFDGLAFEPAGEAAPVDLEENDEFAGEIHFSNTGEVATYLREELKEQGVVFGSWKRLLSEGLSPQLQARFEALLARGIEKSDNKVATWHYAVITHGVFLYVPKFVEIDEPFIIRFEESGNETLRAPHIALSLEAGARARVVEYLSGSEEGEVIYNEGVDVEVGEGGEAKFFSVHNLNLDSTVFSNAHGAIDRDATLLHTTGAFGGMFGKYRVDADLLGPGADALMNGIYFSHEDQHLDLRTTQRHVAPKAHSDTLYKGAVTGESHTIFQGLIRVEHEAVGTDAYLTNNNLVLSEEARSDSIPSLQINTDDVRCSHGSTTGKLDSKQYFYLLSRGYPEHEARRMLVEGYFEAVLSLYPESSQEDIRSIVGERIAESE